MSADEAAPVAEPEMSAAEALARVTEEAARDAAPPARPPDAETDRAGDAGERTELEAAPEAAVDTEPVTEAAKTDGAEAETADEPAAGEQPEAETAEATKTEALEAQPADEPTGDERPKAEAAEATKTEAPEAQPADEPTRDEQPEVKVAEGAKTERPETEAADEPAAAERPESAVAAEPAIEDQPAPEAAAEAATAPQAEAEATAEDEEPADAPAKKSPAVEPPPDRPELRVVREALANRRPLEGRVIGWNNGGFHLALGELSAFCPRSEMEIGDLEEPESYLDKTFLFRVLRLQGKGRRIVVSRAAQLRNEKSAQRKRLRKKLQVGAQLTGTVASLTDFGAFVDLGGTQGLVHVSEISHRRVERPSDVLSEGQEVTVKVLKVEQGGRRISLSMRALEPDPWRDLKKRFPQGAVVQGKVERANQIGAFIELAPGVTGLLPARAMSIPRATTPARAYPPGKEVSVQIVSVDSRRQRIALALEGSGLEGSRSDYREYQQKSRETGEGKGFNALASALRRFQDGAE